jgi:type IX secretion system PorP/SprF family membrane protein
LPPNCQSTHFNKIGNGAWFSIPDFALLFAEKHHPDNRQPFQSQKIYRMHVRKLLLFIVASLSLTALRAQDIHFSQFNMSPMTLNPANIGGFEGTVRLGGIYRGQWASVVGSKSQYKTPAVFADAPIIRGFRKNDWVGLGLSFFTDKAGIGGLTHTATKLGASYHFALNKKGTSYLTLGAQYGQAARRVNPDGFQFEKGFKPDGGYDQNLSVDFANIARDRRSYTDIDGGVVLTSRLNKRMGFNLGFAMYHINEGRSSLVTAGGSGPNPNPTPSAGGSETPTRAVVHGQFNVKLNPRFTFSPQFLFQTMSGSDEIILQAMGGYLFDPAREITLNFGLGYRMRDAIHPMVGAQYKNLRVGLAYDINVSDLNQVSNYRGGFELAANYIIKIYKPAIVKPKVLCPRF